MLACSYWLSATDDSHRSQCAEFSPIHRTVRRFNLASETRHAFRSDGESAYLALARANCSSRASWRSGSGSTKVRSRTLCTFGGRPRTFYRAAASEVRRYPPVFLFYDQWVELCPMRRIGAINAAYERKSRSHQKAEGGCRRARPATTTTSDRRPGNASVKLISGCVHPGTSVSNRRRRRDLRCCRLSLSESRTAGLEGC